MTPPPLTLVEPDTALPLPHASWREEWRPVLARFAATALPRPTLVSHAPLPPHVMARIEAERRRTGRAPGDSYTMTWHLPTDAIADEGLRREMLALAQAFYDYELPACDALVLTGMLDGPGGDSARSLIAWLRGAIAQIGADPSSALAPPTSTETGQADGSFAPHSDMWIPALLLNIFNQSVAGQGVTLLMPMEKLWPLVRESGMPDAVIAQLELARIEAGECDYYDHFNGLLYGGHPWTPALRSALHRACWCAEMKPGQGYFVNDRNWLHGRTELARDALPAERKDHRLYRLAYNNRRLDALAARRRVRWAAIGRVASGCKGA